jgi:hypothetical protein
MRFSLRSAGCPLSIMEMEVYTVNPAAPLITEIRIYFVR